MNANTIKRNLRALVAALLAAACALPGMALASPGVCDGAVVATGEVAVFASCDARVNDIPVRTGQTVRVGDALIELKTEKAYAHEDGTVASLEVDEGECADGTVLKVAPVSRYRIVCSTEDAYETPANMLLQMGQTVYAKCKKDGSHRAVARVTGIEGEMFTLEALGGELYVGEVVYLYGSDEFDRRDRVGIGTVVSNDPAEYQAVGCITHMCVEPGDTVERGQLLYEYLPGDGIASHQSTMLTSGASGIVTAINAQEGQTLSDGSAAVTIAPTDGLRISVLLDEYDAADVCAGDRVSILLPWQEDEDAISGTVESVAHAAHGDAALGSTTAGGTGTMDSASGAAVAGGVGADTTQLPAGAADYMQGGTADITEYMQSGSADVATYTQGDMTAASGYQQGGSASAQSDTPRYQVLICVDDPSQLRIGMSATVAFPD